MADFVVTKFEELHNNLRRYSPNISIFRGIKSLDYKLVPSVGRMSFKKNRSREKEEQLIFNKFCQRAIPFLEFKPEDLWDWLTLAQHHGLPTRLLDWTLNSLVATYFAVEDDDFEGDSVVYVLNKINEIDIKHHPNPFDISKVNKYLPRHITRRQSAQTGLFTVHPIPTIPFENEKIDRIILKSECRRVIKITLYKYGIHRASLFPDLDRFASHIKWLREDREEFVL